ncbi:hypothetical protein C2845_PM06G19220 [Panicum miliaceum]|uniref:Protein IQ-DOMAIN 1-like n=1 Tax=Panicum miliaceum TaxID=4540 RepID=A0A3L6R5F9_PANMI|nr:hypothetical protein C2845_PM06G19220 [Panicum miliaceum]
MGKKGKWFDAVQRILSTSEPDPVEVDAKKAAKLKDKPSFKKIWQFGKSHPSGASASAAPAPDPAAHQPQPAPSPRPGQQQAEETTAEAQRAETRCDDGGVRPADVASKAGDDAADAAAVARPTVTTPRAWAARSKEDIAATRIQAACRGYMARRAHQERGMARLMSLVEGFTIKRQTEEALYCMQTMTRIQTQLYSRRLKTEEDKKALKSQVKVKQSLDKIKKIGGGWDHSLQSKEQMEAVLMMKQEAASRRQRALSYAFSYQWRNRKPSSARAAPAPMFMDPGNPNWGWSWTERWMAAARPWENQTAAPADGRAAAKSAGRMPRVAVSIQIPTTTTPGSRSFRPPNWPSLPSPSTPPPRSPSLPGRTAVTPLRRTTSLRAELPRRLSLGSATGTGTGTAASPAGDDAGAPVTPSYMQQTKSVKAKARCASPSASSAAADVFDDAPGSGTAPLRVPSSSSARKRLSLEFADKPSASSPSKVGAERVTRRQSQPPSPRMSSLS